MTARSKKIRLGDLLPDLGLVGELGSHQSLEIRRISSAEASEAGDLVFIAQEKFLPFLASRQAAAFVVSSSLWHQAEKLAASGPLFQSKDAMLAFAKASRHFSSEGLRPSSGIHPTAVVHPSAKIAASALIGAHVVIAEDAMVADGAWIHSHVSIGARSRVGRDSVLFPNVVLYQDVELGERVRIHSGSVVGADGFGYVQEKSSQGVRHVKIHHLGGVRIGNDVEIGASTTIDRGTLGHTVIGDGCIIDNQVQIGHNCELEEGVIICGSTGLSGSVHVEKFALIAGLVGVANKVRIGRGAQVAGMTAVTGHVPAGAKWGGIPAMPRGEYARLQVYFKRLPELFERFKKEGKV